MTVKLADLCKTHVMPDGVTKPHGCYSRYDEVFDRLGFVPRNILEIGVHFGVSTKIFASAYPQAKIVGIDVQKHPIDFSSFPHITYLQADQGNAQQLEEIIKRHFSGELIDLVIDDASHVGQLSRQSFDAVFPYVRSGGLYCIEDWGTGYWDDWPDGGRFQEYPANPYDGTFPKRIPSHDFGMVGFIKSLIDLAGEVHIRPTSKSPTIRSSRIRTLEISYEVCIVHKA